jgi:uncharacterized membrane protein
MIKDDGFFILGAILFPAGIITGMLPLYALGLILVLIALTLAIRARNRKTGLQMIGPEPLVEGDEI